jgi:hypothetical protein
MFMVISGYAGVRAPKQLCLPLDVLATYQSLSVAFLSFNFEKVHFW